MRLKPHLAKHTAGWIAPTASLAGAFAVSGSSDSNPRAIASITGAGIAPLQSRASSHASSAVKARYVVFRLWKGHDEGRRGSCSLQVLGRVFYSAAGFCDYLAPYCSSGLA
jgi:hypothetical protein